MFKKYIKPVLAGLIVVITIGAFAYYISRHPEIIDQLKHLPVGTAIILILLYVVFMLCLSWVQRATLELCGIRLGRKESALLVSYSSIINFFGPLQSGPAFRAAYLKRKHDVSLKNYAGATLLYYGFYAAFSALFILTYFIHVWALLIIIIGVIVAPILLKNKSARRYIPAKFRNLKLESIGQLATATLAQVCTLAVIFYLELRVFSDTPVDKVAALVYTGAANFALFVSITPGAIGFREAFLVFTQRLHEFANPLIVSANVLDRSVYIIFMALLAVVVFGLHAGDALSSTRKPGAKK